MLKAIALSQKDFDIFNEFIAASKEIYLEDETMRRRFLEVILEDASHEKELELFTEAIGFVFENIQRFEYISDSHQDHFWQQEKRDIARNQEYYNSFLSTIETCVLDTKEIFDFGASYCFNTFMRLDFIKSLIFFSNINEDFENLDRTWVLLKNELDYVNQSCSDDLNRDVERCEIIDAGLPSSISRIEWREWSDALKL